MSKKETKFNFDGIEEIASETPAGQQQQVAEDILTDREVSEVQTDIDLEKKHGDQPLRTFLEAGASSASFGLSDQVLTKLGGEEMKEAMRERRQRNEEAALAGELSGVIVPTALSSGTSALAKGASLGVKTAAGAGKFIEKLSAKQLAKIIQDTGKKKLATEIIKKSIPLSAGSAVEGAFYGAGQLISEDALGTAEFNAENLLASAGTGAMIGGTLGGILGTAEGLIPVVKNNKLVDIVSRKINTNVDKRIAGAKLAKMTQSEIAKLKNTKWGEEVFDNIPKYFKRNLDLKITDDLEKLYTKSNAEMARLGEEIGNTAKKIDKLAEGTSILPKKSQIALKVQNSLKEIAEQFKKSPDEVAKKSLKKIQRRIRSWDEWMSSDKPIKASDIKELKTSLQQATKWNKSIDQIPLDGKLDRQVAEAVRQEFLDLADRVSTVDNAIGDKLRKLNLDYGTALTVTNKLKRAVDKETAASFAGFKDLLLADILTDISGGGLGVATGAVATKKFLESDLRRKLTLLTNIEKSNIKVGKKINNSVKEFFTTAKKASIPTSTKALLSVNWDTPNESGKRRKKAKTKLEAFKNISEDLQKMTSDPAPLMDHLSKNAMKLSGAAPSTVMALNSTIAKSIQFLNEKLPKDSSSGIGLFSRKWEPSSIELSKFERYLNAVDNPLSVLDDLKSGTITREAVEAIKVVYPDLYVRIQQETMNHIAENHDIQYSKRLELGILLDIPADSSLLPDNIAALQQIFADREQQRNAARKEQVGAIKPTQKGLENIDFASEQKPQTEKTITRK